MLLLGKGEKFRKKKLKFLSDRCLEVDSFRGRNYRTWNRAISFILLCKALGAEEVFKKTES